MSIGFLFYDKTRSLKQLLSIMSLFGDSSFFPAFYIDVDFLICLLIPSFIEEQGHDMSWKISSFIFSSSNVNNAILLSVSSHVIK